ncbi:MAG TPA: peptidoglycan-binding protein [Acidimicrobiia bacterium]|nr:peptidoglycan-binding protein [Acidimicrobiia bacterium]
MPEPFRALGPGAEGEAVRDLQHRLATLGFDTSPAEAGMYEESTAAAVRAFQTARGLRVDGICGRQTWSSLVEAGYRLGDRLLYHRTPMLRGDDVLELQEKLNALGFDAGRGDGIFGPHTADALRDFQRNVAAVNDGICGPESIAALERLSRFAGGSVASVREKEALRDGALRLAGRRVYLAVEPGLDALGDVVTRGLVELGAEVLVDGSGEDDSTVAAEANRYAADLFLGLRFGDICSSCACDYFASHASRSEGGCHVARCITEELSAVLGCDPAEPAGRAYAVLRETRMPAVVCQPVQADDVEGVRRLVSRAGAAGRAIVHGVRRGVEEPL